MNDNFDPLIIGFCCNWCSYAGADLAGVSRIQYPTSLRIVRVMCSGMVHPNLVIDALTKGADGVLICGCHIGDCHYQEGNMKAEKRAEDLDWNGSPLLKVQGSHMLWENSRNRSERWDPIQTKRDQELKFFISPSSS
jgi:coenzyme F420-reducing hydrogenase delta subunit